MNSIRSLTAAAILAGLAGSASAQMVVDTDLGTLLGGTTTNISGAGDDGSIAGNAEAYNAPLDQGGLGAIYRTYVAKEWVFQFTITEDSTITLTNNLSDLAADRDYTICDSLGTSLQTLDTGDWLVADGGLDWIDGDFGVATEVFEGGPYPAGTYYLVMDEFTLADGSGAPGLGGVYDVDLIVDTFEPPSEPTVFTDLGIIGNSGGLTTLEVCGSDFDTELGVFDSNGTLVANNDDACGLQSSLGLGLAAGTYWASVSGFNTTFSNGWQATGSGRASGNFAGSFGTAAVGDVLGTDEVAYFKFEIETGVVMPPPAIDLGDVASVEDIFSIDTFSSDYDTELGLWDSNGALLGNNDDAGGVLQSELVPLQLAEGTYYFSVSAFNTTFSGLFGASTTSSTVGNYGGQVNGTGFSGVQNAGEITFYSFNVTDGGTPCPGDIGDAFGSAGSDGVVDFGDFLFLLSQAGPCGTPCPGDIGDAFGSAGMDGVVDFGDFLYLLSQAGPCP